MEASQVFKIGLLEDANDSWLGLVVNKVIDLVVAMDQCSPVLRLRAWIPQKRDRVIVVRNLSYSSLRFVIDGFGLGRGNRAEGLDLAVVKAR